MSHTHGGTDAPECTTCLCDGCNVREPWEHRCHGRDTCSCPECREVERLFGF